MIDLNTVKRVMIVILLLTSLCILFIYHGSLDPAPEMGAYPNEEDLIDDYERYIGEEAEVGGKVISTDPIIIELEHGDRTIDLELTGFDDDVEEGDHLSVYGIVRQDLTFEVKNGVVRPFFNIVYMYVISFAAAMWLAFRILSQWRWNGDHLEPREKPMSILLPRGDEDG